MATSSFPIDAISSLRYRSVKEYTYASSTFSIFTGRGLSKKAYSGIRYCFSAGSGAVTATCFLSMQMQPSICNSSRPAATRHTCFSVLKPDIFPLPLTAQMKYSWVSVISFMMVTSQ